MYLNRTLIFIILFSFACPAQAFFFKESRQQKKMLADASAAYELGDYRTAVEITQEFLLKNAGKHNAKDAYVMLGNSYKAMGQYDKALLKYNEAIEFYPKDADLMQALGDVYFIGGLTEKAIEVYKKTLELNPKTSAAKIGLAESYLSEGFFDRAAKYFEEYIAQTKSTDPQVYYDYALSRFHANDYDGALALTQKSLSLKADANTTFLLAKIYKARGDKQNAFLAIDTALKQNPEDDVVFLTRALWLARDKNTAAEGLAAANEYLDKNPQDSLAMFAKYFAQDNLGDVSAAQKTLKAITETEGDGFINKLALKIYKAYNN